MTILDIRPAEDHDKVKQYVNGLSDAYNISTNWSHITKGGQVMRVDVTSHKLRFNNRECSMVMALDVTSKVIQGEKLQAAYKVEMELRKELEGNIELLKHSLDSKQKLAEVIDRINNMVMITDPFGAIIWVNEAFERFTGFGLNEVLGKTSHFLHGPDTDPGTQGEIMEAIDKNGFGTFEILNYTKAGQEYWVELNISAIYNDEQQVVRYISIQNLITERKQREEKIKEQNRILRKHSWTNSHTIRKPVASILSLVGLSREMDNMEELKEIHSLIELSSKELDDVLQEIGKELNACEDNVS